MELIYPPLKNFGKCRVTSWYGERGEGFHNGTDYAKKNIFGKDIIASHSGEVISVMNRNIYGRTVIVNSKKGDYSTLYAHCNKIYAEQGQMIARGQIIAQVGTSGYSTGPHLHFELRNEIYENEGQYFRKIKGTDQFKNSLSPIKYLGHTYEWLGIEYLLSEGVLTEGKHHALEMAKKGLVGEILRRLNRE